MVKAEQSGCLVFCSCCGFCYPTLARNTAGSETCSFLVVSYLHGDAIAESVRLALEAWVDGKQLKANGLGHQAAAAGWCCGIA